MMFIFLFFLCIPQEIFGISCIYSEESLEWKLNEFDLDAFEKTMDEIPNVNVDYKDDNINMCRIEIYIDYQSNQLILSFADSFDWSPLDHGEGRLEFLIMFHQNKSVDGYYHVLEYACHDENQCEKIFLFHHIQWLKQVNYSIFQKHLTDLLFTNASQTVSCFTDKKKLIECPKGVCVGKYSKHQQTYLFECHENSDTLTEVHITTSMIIQAFSFGEQKIQEQQIIRYTCKFNQCNQQSLTDALTSIVEKYFPLLEMRDALFLSYQQTHSNSSNTIPFQTKTTTIQQFSSLTTTGYEYILFNSTKKSFFISNNLIITLILLFLLFDI